MIPPLASVPLHDSPSGPEAVPDGSPLMASYARHHVRNLHRVTWLLVPGGAHTTPAK
jgi:hypothetical protein